MQAFSRIINNLVDNKVNKLSNKLVSKAGNQEIPEIDMMLGESVELRRHVALQVCYSAGKLPAMVFLHGGLGNRFNWRSQYEFFQAAGQTVLAYDLAGHGQSSPYSRYSIDRHCRDLFRLLQHFQISEPILCCHSYGVPLGLEWAQQYSVKGLLLICGGTHNLDPWWEIPLMQFLTWGGRYLYQLPGVSQISNALSSSHQHCTIQRFFAESPMPVSIHPYQALQIFWGYHFFNCHKTNRKANRKTAAKLNMPVLVISGGQDPTFTEAMATTLAASFPYSQQLHLPQAGHLLMAEYPELINQAILNWIKNCG